MFLVYLFIAYFGILKKISIKNFIMVFISLILIISLVQFENYSITGTSLLERPYDIEYDQRAEPKILFKVNLLEAARNRSEEHTSELQSRSEPVCRLLLSITTRALPTPHL